MDRGCITKENYTQLKSWLLFSTFRKEKWIKTKNLGQCAQREDPHNWLQNGANWGSISILRVYSADRNGAGRMAKLTALWPQGNRKCFSYIIDGSLIQKITKKRNFWPEKTGFHHKLVRPKHPCAVSNNFLSPIHSWHISESLRHLADVNVWPYRRQNRQQFPQQPLSVCGTHASLPVLVSGRQHVGAKKLNHQSLNSGM